ncbi:MAG: tetratricopeptide repeat protein [Terracidiphilus sp.]
MRKTLLELGYRASRERRLAEAKAHFAKAVEQSRKAGEKTWLAPSLVGLGKIERDLQESDAALKHYQDAVQVYRTLDEPLALAHTIRHVGDILRNRKQLDLAAPCYVEALAIYRGNEATPPLDLANAIRGYALLKGEAGDREGATLLWQEAGRLYASVGVQAGVDESEKQIARVAG